MPIERFNFDAPKLTRDEATELCVYHLRMAGALFQLVPDDNNKSLLDEINRQFDGLLEQVDLVPLKLWAAAILAAYEDMKERD